MYGPATDPAAAMGHVPAKKPHPPSHTGSYTRKRRVLLTVRFQRDPQNAEIDSEAYGRRNAGAMRILRSAVSADAGPAAGRI